MSRSNIAHQEAERFLNPKPETINFKPSHLNPIPEPYILDPKIRCLQEHSMRGRSSSKDSIDNCTYLC